jgi:cardiolipin synthase
MSGQSALSVAPASPVSCPPKRRLRPALTVLWAIVLLTAFTGCGAVRPNIVMPGVAIGDGLFLRTVEGITGAPLTEGNAVSILLNGDEIFPAQLRAIRAARKTITYAQYFYEDGPNADSIAAALADRCREGVKVHALLDGFGTLNMPTSARQVLERAGCQLAIFRPVTGVVVGRVNNRNHRRILVVDGRIGFTGGSGVSWRWMGDGRTQDHWRDTDARVEGPGVQYLQSAFVENWLEATGVMLGGEEYFPQHASRGSARVQVVRSSPVGGRASMYSMFLLAISSARRYIHITNPYFVPDGRMIEALLEAARRGVDIVVLLPGKIDSNLVRQASRGELGQLMKAGITVYEYRAALLHSKTIVIDDRWCTVGSTNFDNRSFAFNEELNLAIYSTDVASRLERVFADDLIRSHKLTYEAWKHRGVKSRLLEWLSLPIKEQL